MRSRKQRHRDPERWLRRQWAPDIVQPSPKTILEMAREAREHHACLFYLPTLDTNGFTTSHAMLFERPLPPPPPPAEHLPAASHTSPACEPQDNTLVADNSSWSTEDANRHDSHDGTDDIEDPSPASNGEETDNHTFTMQITRISDSDRGIVHLAKFDLTSFHIPSPTIPYLSGLVSLRLQDNRLTTVPDAIFRLPCLRELDLSYNQLSTLSGLIALLAPTLEGLYLQSNQLTSLPQQLGRLTRLKILDIADNSLACVPVELKRLVSDSVTNSNSSSHLMNQPTPATAPATTPLSTSAAIAAAAARSHGSTSRGVSSRGLPLRRGTTGSSGTHHSGGGGGGIRGLPSTTGTLASHGHGVIMDQRTGGVFANGAGGLEEVEEDEDENEEDEGVSTSISAPSAIASSTSASVIGGGNREIQEGGDEDEDDEVDATSEMDVLLDTADESGEGGHHDDDYVQIRPGIKCWTRGNRFWQVDHHSPGGQSTSTMGASMYSFSSSSSPSHHHHRQQQQQLQQPATTTGFMGEAGTLGFFVPQQNIMTGGFSQNINGRGEPALSHSRIPTAFDTLASMSSNNNTNTNTTAASFATSGLSHDGHNGGAGASLIHEAAHARKDSYTSSPWTPSLSDLCSQIVGEWLYRDPHFYCTADTCPDKWRQQRLLQQERKGQDQRQRSQRQRERQRQQQQRHEQGEGQQQQRRRRQQNQDDQVCPQKDALNVREEEGEEEVEEGEDDDDDTTQRQQRYERWLAKGKMKAGEDGLGSSNNVTDQQHWTSDGMVSTRAKALHHEYDGSCMDKEDEEAENEEEEVEEEEEDVEAGAGPVDYEQCVIRLLPEWTMEQLGLFKIAELRKSLVAHDRKLRRERREKGDGGGNEYPSSSESSDEDDEEDGRGQGGGGGGGLQRDWKSSTTTSTAQTSAKTRPPSVHPLFRQQRARIAWTVEELEQERDRCSICGQRLFFEGMVWKRVGVLSERVVPLELVACSVACRSRADQEERLKRREAHMRHRRRRWPQPQSPQQQQQQYPNVGSASGESVSPVSVKRGRASTHTMGSSATSSMSIEAGGGGGGNGGSHSSRASIGASSSPAANQESDGTTSTTPTLVPKTPMPRPSSILHGLSLLEGQTNTAGDEDFVPSPTSLTMPSSGGAGGSSNNNTTTTNSNSNSSTTVTRWDSTTSTSSYSQGVEHPRSSSPWPSEDLLQSQPLSQAADSSRVTPTAASFGRATGVSGDGQSREDESWSYFGAATAGGGGDQSGGSGSGGTIRGRDHFVVSPLPKTSFSSNSSPTPRRSGGGGAEGDPLANAAGDVQQPQQQQEQQHSQEPVVFGEGTVETNEPPSIFTRFPPPLPPLIPMTTPVGPSSFVPPTRPYGGVHYSRLIRSECTYLCLVRQNPRTRSFSI
ncbi:hypothetical protein DFQ27_007736 [Actinomortierella ambigua]|uniref:Uncharacterized protein n=1 Tax=Actinomortierella ambigua TaxID=1343610 RepID=A0A9P6PS95_9FUNG|nr:hypothetical protein DFQ27_007736 [Actinomortierella ambigua]